MDQDAASPRTSPAGIDLELGWVEVSKQILHTKLHQKDEIWHARASSYSLPRACLVRKGRLEYEATTTPSSLVHIRIYHFGAASISKFSSQGSPSCRSSTTTFLPLRCSVGAPTNSPCPLSSLPGSSQLYKRVPYQQRINELQQHCQSATNEALETDHLRSFAALTGDLRPSTARSDTMSRAGILAALPPTRLHRLLRLARA
jgi:hypothetical protein